MYAAAAWMQRSGYLQGCNVVENCSCIFDTSAIRGRREAAAGSRGAAM